MDILSLILILAFIGVVTYCIVRFIPMPPPIHNIIIVVAVITCALIALNAFGVIGAIRGVQVPRVR